MCENRSVDDLRLEQIQALLRAEGIDFNDNGAVVASLSETVMAKSNTECYLRAVVLSDYHTSSQPGRTRN